MQIATYLDSLKGQRPVRRLHVWLAAKAVLVAPPEDRRKSRFKTHFAEVLFQPGDFDAAVLAPFVVQAKPAN